jgi:hypothetical protein
LHKQKVEEAVPAEMQGALLPLVRMTAALSDSIQGYIAVTLNDQRSKRDIDSITMPAPGPE